MPTVNLDRLVKYAEKLHWLKIAPDGVPELYLDHHAMSTFRMCEERFFLEFVQGIGTSGRVWFLEFGTVVHNAIELYYQQRQDNTFELDSWAFSLVQMWHDADLNYFDGRSDPKGEPHKNFKSLGGLPGFVSLMEQYARHFAIQNERFRVIGTELFFGKKKEVPLLEDSTRYSFAPFRAYLTGKIDLLLDDGQSIGPMDHKTSASFRGKSMITRYEVQDGMTGYVYAAKKLVQLTMPPEELARKDVNKIWMNFIQVAPTAAGKESERFSRLPLFKSEEQLEDFRVRQIGTMSAIFQCLNEDRPRQWNTNICQNWMHSTCEFHSVHRQGSTNAMVSILNNQFKKKEIWNPERPDLTGHEASKESQD
jgi:hypothetical protein